MQDEFEKLLLQTISEFKACEEWEDDPIKLLEWLLKKYLDFKKKKEK